jgi:hypothetical protein
MEEAAARQLLQAFHQTGEEHQEELTFPEEQRASVQ